MAIAPLVKERIAWVPPVDVLYEVDDGWKRPGREMADDLLVSTSMMEIDWRALARKRFGRRARSRGRRAAQKWRPRRKATGREASGFTRLQSFP